MCVCVCGGGGGEGGGGGGGVEGGGNKNTNLHRPSMSCTLFTDTDARFCLVHKINLLKDPFSLRLVQLFMLN